jgi:ABC-type branched-subunit amino acid transport system substrate-binding protein
MKSSPVRARSAGRIALLAGVLAALVGSLAVVPGGVAGAAAKPTGAPITIETIGEFQVTTGGSANPEVSAAVQARAKAINKAGGLKDASGATHKLNVIVCNTNNDPNQAEQCARKAVDSKVAAVVGNFSAIGSSIYPTLEAAGIPSIGPEGTEPVALSSKVSFPLGSGIPGIFFGMPRLLVQQGKTKISVIYPDLPAASSALPLLDLALAKDNLKVVNKVGVALDAADLAPQLAAVTANGTDGIVGFVIGDNTGKFFQGLQQQSYSGKVATVGVFITPDILKQLGPALNGVLLVNNFVPATNTKVPAIKTFNKDMDAFKKGLSKSDAAVNAWAATWVFERVAKTLPTIDAASTLDAMGKLTNFDMGGLTAPITTTQPYAGPVPLPRLFNPTVVYAQIKNGKVVQVSKTFENPFQ